MSAPARNTPQACRPQIYAYTTPQFAGRSHVKVLVDCGFGKRSVKPISQIDENASGSTLGGLRIFDLNIQCKEQVMAIAQRLGQNNDTGSEGGELPNWQHYVDSRLARLGAREHDPRPSIEVVARTRKLLHDVMPTIAPIPSVVLSEHGGVELVWRLFNAAINIEINDEGKPQLLCRVPTLSYDVDGDLEVHTPILMEALAYLGEKTEEQNDER